MLVAPSTAETGALNCDSRVGWTCDDDCSRDVDNAGRFGWRIGRSCRHHGGPCDVAERPGGRAADSVICASRLC